MFKHIIKKIYGMYPFYSFHKSLIKILFIRTIDFLIKIIYYKFSYENRKIFNQTKKYKNTFKDFNVFVFGGGSSLNKIDLRKIKRYQKEKNYKVFCVSSYIISDAAGIVMPDFYLLSDPAFFGETSKVSKERLKEIEETIKKINDNNIICFVPLQFKNRNKINNVVYFNDFEYRWSKNVTDITKPRSYLSLTAYKAIAVACYLGFEKIYICGIDCDYFKYIEVNEKNEIYYLNPHFFNQSDSCLLKVTKDWANNLGELLYKLSFLFLDFYKFPKDKIINLDKTGLIDAFTKEHNLDVYKDE